VIDPLSNTAKAIRGAYAATYEANAAKVAADVLAGLQSDGSRSDGTTSTGGPAVDIDVNPAATANISSIVLGASGSPTIAAGTGVAAGTQPSGSIWVRTDGAAGARLYVSQGGGTWIAIAAV
jgi:hypothetical protein